jgi:hypothetical protein
MGIPASIDFVMNGKVDGVEITPRTIGLARFNAFNQQVEQFIGAEGLDTDSVRVETAEGSYILRSFLGAVALAELEPDLNLMRRQDVLGELPDKRAEVVKKWQSTAKASEGLSYEIRTTPEAREPRVIRIDHQTDYRIGEIVPWVQAERYLLGTVTDMGGAGKANIHLRLDGSNQLIRIASNQDFLKENHNDRLYHRVVVRVKGEQHFQTGKMRNLRLIEFADYQPKFDPVAFEKFTAEGRKAWADVPDAASWVREVRGG